MKYTARNLPVWVRFQAKPRHRDRHGQPTAMEAAMQRMMHAQEAAMLTRIKQPNWFLTQRCGAA